MLDSSLPGVPFFNYVLTLTLLLLLQFTPRSTIQSRSVRADSKVANKTVFVAHMTSYFSSLIASDVVLEADASPPGCLEA